MQNKNEERGFSLVELVVVIAIMAVLMAVLAPSLLRYVEKSRMQRDESAMGEVVHATKLALADMDAYDEAFRYAVDDNYIDYADSDGAKTKDEEFWAATGSRNKTMTITYYANESKTYVLGDGIINNMGKGKSVAEKKSSGDGDTKLSQLTNIYSIVNRTIGESVTKSSSTYRNSDYTVFVNFTVNGGISNVDVNGSWNGTNLSANAITAEGAASDCHWTKNAEDTIHTCSVHNETHSPNYVPVDHNNADGDWKCTQCDLTRVGTGSVEVAVHTHKYEKVDDTYHKCIEVNCTIETPDHKEEHEYDADGKCVSCGASHVCTGNPCSICGCYTFSITPNNKGAVGYKGVEGENLVIPATFVGNGEYGTIDGRKYRVIWIHMESFWHCTGLTSVTIPDGVTTIAQRAFDDCTNLTSVTIPDSVTNLSMDVFRGCTSLASVTIPKGVTVIRSDAFSGCTSLTSVTIPDSVKSIEDDAFYYCTSLTSVTIPDSVTSIGNYAFSGCTSLTSVTIPDSVTSIGSYAFRGCTSLTSVTIPKGITVIENSAFNSCSSLSSIEIPSSVTSIGELAFYNCQSLTSITYGGTKEQWKAIIKNNRWNDKVPTSCIVHCNDGCVGPWGTSTTCLIHQ